MDAVSYKTKFLNSQTVTKEWFIVDAENQTLGRLTSQVAKILRGKHKPGFTPHVDCGDHVIVINAEKIKFTGKKMDDKVYVRHTGYPGGQRYSTPKTLLASKPEFIIERAVKKMLPQTRLGGQIIRNLHVYANDKHTHEAQQPKAVDLKSLLEKKSK